MQSPQCHGKSHFNLIKPARLGSARLMLHIYPARHIPSPRSFFLLFPLPPSRFPQLSSTEPSRRAQNRRRRRQMGRAAGQEKGRQSERERERERPFRNSTEQKAPGAGRSSTYPDRGRVQSPTSFSRVLPPAAGPGEDVGLHHHHHPLSLHPGRRSEVSQHLQPCPPSLPPHNFRGGGLLLSVVLALS